MKAFLTAVACGLLTTTLASAQGVTFNKDVAPILYKNCVSCHQPNSMAPMSLIDYATVRPYARAIRRAVDTRQMPPWFADPQYGHFSNDPRLSDQAIATIKAWVDAGAPEGDASDRPASPVLTSGFKLGKPDIVIDIGEDFLVPPGDDVRKTFVVPTNFKEGQWVRAAEVLPGNPRLVHHVHLSVVAGDAEPESEGVPLSAAKKQQARETQTDGRSLTLWELIDGQLRLRDDAPVVNDACTGELPKLPNLNASAREGGSFATMLPGKGADVFDVFGDGSTAKWIPPGAKLSFSMHYAKVDKPLVDRTSVGLYLAKAPPDKPVKRLDVRNHYFLIPAGADSQAVKRCIDFPEDKVMLSITPHMHYRGKHARYELVRPDGRRETLLYVPNYSFQWQLNYRFKEPVVIEKGSRMVITFTYDNSRGNRLNPDASRLVRWGDRSEDEMMATWTEVIDALPSRSISRDK